jgi:hypothetical protein
VTQRERWQALQARLSAAQAFIEAGDSQKALAEVNAALTLDPDFLAAQALRDRLLKKPARIPPPTADRQAPADKVLTVSPPVEPLPSTRRTAAASPPTNRVRREPDFVLRLSAPSARPESVDQPASVPFAQAHRDRLFKKLDTAWPPPPAGAQPPAAQVSSPSSRPAETVPSTRRLPATPPVSDRVRHDAERVRYDADLWLRLPPPPPREEPVQKPTSAPSQPSAHEPLVSAEGYAHFEARAKRRRVDRRIEAARAALGRRKLHEAASALDEIIALDPNLPELAGLTAQFDELRKAISTPHRGPWLMAAAVFAVVVLGASYVHESTSLLSYPVKGEVSLVTPPRPSLQLERATSDPTAVATVGVTDDAVADVVARPERARSPRAAAVRPAALPAMLRDRSSQPDRVLALMPSLPEPAPASGPVSDLGPSAPVSTPPQSPPPAPAVPPRAATPAASNVSAPVPAPASIPTGPDDEGLVKQALQRYRHAYEGLDARSAHAVWPAVNQAQLARAFDALASQAITFDACDVQVRGAMASATCRGTARYVPKIGSREPRVEPRVWSFALKKDGADWKIDSARTDGR